jgi:hypothetical protein
MIHDTRMHLKDAVRASKAFVADLFADEGLYDLLLEEVTFDPEEKLWRVTVSFQRKTNENQTGIAALAISFRRAYKVVTISDTNAEVISVKERENTN